MKLRYGTRGSSLALAQSDALAVSLTRRVPGLRLERVDVKALRAEQLEHALLEGRIDLAIHSSKDLPARLPGGLAILAYPEREDPRDVLVGSKHARRWIDLRPGDTIATAAARRRLQLAMAAPGVRFVPMRGNIDARLRRIERGEADGLVLARAGLKRLGREDLLLDPFPVDIVVPAPGQGALAVEGLAERGDLRELLASIDHAPTRLAVECERLFVRLMGGGCRMPLGAYARERGGLLLFRWFWVDDDGLRARRGFFQCAPCFVEFARKAGELADSLLRRGAPVAA